jgi:hypothetical protein
MNYLGSDFNSSGSVMAKAELTVARTKRGECVTCGRKCYRKKLFKMVPLDEPGKVLNGRCLNCKPLQSNDISVSSSLKSHSCSHSRSHSGGNSQSHDRNPVGRGNRNISISNSKSNSKSNSNSNSISNNGGRNRRMAMRKKKSSSHLHQQQYRNHHQHHQSSPHLWKSNSSKGVALAIDVTEVSTKGEPKSPPGRTNSTPISTSRYYSSPPTVHNRHNSTHSSISRTTADTALTTRPSIASSSTSTARKNTGSISTLSIGSVSSDTATAAAYSNVNRKGNSNFNRKGDSSSTSGRSLAITESFGSSACETTATKSPEISWTPPPHHSEFGCSDDDMNNHNSNSINVNTNTNIRSSSRCNSIKSVNSTTSKHYPPTRDELEQAAFTLMAARQHGLTRAGGALYQDMFDKLASSDHNLDSGDCSNHGGRMDSPRKKHRSHVIDENETVDDNDDDDDDVNSKRITDASLNSSLIDSFQSPDAEPKYSFPNSQNQDIEQNSTIAESNISVPNTVSIAEEDDQIVSMHSHQHSQNHIKKGILNRGGAFQPRHAHGHGRPGVGTHVYEFAGSTRTMSSMSSIGEEDHLLMQNSLEQKNSQIPHRRQNLSRMGSFSRYRQVSCRTLGSLSTIEVINEEDTRIQSSLEDSSAGSISVDRLSVSTPTTSLRLGEEVAHTGIHVDEQKEAHNDSQDQRRPLDSPTKTSGLVNVNQYASAPTNQDEEVHGVYNDTCNLFQDQLIFLRESSESPDKTRKALEILSECETPDNCKKEINPCGMDIVVTCMHSHSVVYDVQLWGCRAIWNMSSSRPKVQNAFVQAGASDVIAQAMKRFLKSGEDLQEEAITVLSSLAINPPNMDYLLGKGDDAVEAIITAMGQYPETAGVQTKGCEALAILASHNDSTLRLRIMDKGAGEAILFNAVAMHSEDFVVQKAALSAVRNLCTDCEENQNRLLELGVVDPILSTIKKHRSVAGLQEAGAGAISLLAGNNVETKRVIEENGGIKLTLRAILDHSNILEEKECYIRTLMTLALDSYNGNHSESRNSEDNNKAAVGVIHAVIDAIGTSQEGTNPPKLALAIDAVIIAMETHEDDSAVQEVGFAILGGLADLVDEGIAINTDQTKMDIVDEGALDVINMAMVLHKHEANVQERACAVLLSLAIEENYAAIIAAIGIQLIQDAAKDFPDRCCELANRLIQRLGEDENNNEE